MKTIQLTFCAAFAAIIANAEPVVDRVVARQQWPWSTEIRIDYTLAGATAPVDVNLEFKDGDTTLSVAPGSAAIQGDVYYVGNGLHTITVDPIAAFGTAKQAFADFKVRVTPTASSSLPDNKVLYKIVDLVNSNVTDVTRSELLLGKYGTVVTDYSQIGTGFSTPLTDVVVWTGVKDNDEYKTTKLVLRRIPAGTFNMGSPADEQYRCRKPSSFSSAALQETQHPVTLTKDFWIGVFPITQGQYKLITGSATVPTTKHDYTHCSDTDLHPVYDVRYKEDVRGSSKGSEWPSSHDVDASSILGKLRSILNGDLAFDLPTEAQWEYACRGGNEGSNIFYSGKLSYANGAVQSDNRNEICWNYYNSKDLDDSTKVVTQAVGGKLPNAFGLYDMLGNVGEWTLDHASAGSDYDLVNTSDPVGLASGNYVIRGGDVGLDYGTSAFLRSASRIQTASVIYSAVHVGFRVCVTEE